MATFLGLGTSVLFGNTVRASIELLADQISPISPNDTITINGSIVTDDIQLTATNTVVGKGAGPSNTGNNNTFLGSEAGLSNTSGSSNTYVGREAGEANTTGSGNTFLGATAGKLNTTGGDNTFLGQQAGDSNTVGNNNVFIGTGCFDANVDGSDNVGLGFIAGFTNTDGGGNVYIGSQSGFGIANGNNNVCVGLFAGRDASDTTSGCVLLGTSAGQNNTISNRLMIDNSNTNEPLIDGSFSSDTLQINGAVTLGQTGNTTNVHAVNGDVDGAGAAGGGGAVPATVEEYLVVTINGNTRRIPLFL